MNKKIGFFGSVVLFSLVCGPVCNADAVNTYKLEIIGNNNNVLITCLFSGKDTDGNGIIERQELVDFKETEQYKFTHTSSIAGWRAYVDVDSMPMLTHTVEDIKVFAFSVADFAEGVTRLEYHTESKEDFIYDNYHFWRIVEIDSEAGKIGLFHGIGDGTQGLALTMTDPDSLSFVIEKTRRGSP